MMTPEKADLPSDISLPPNYAPSEAFTDSPPPAYQKPGMAAIRIARIVCFTLLAMTFIIGFFVVGHKWIQSREHHHETVSNLQNAALFQQIPDLQILDSNKIDDNNNEETPTTPIEEIKEIEKNVVKMATEDNAVRQEEPKIEKENTLEQAMKETMKKLNDDTKIPVDLLLGNPSLAGRNVQCKVQKKQQNIADGIITQAIIVTCDDDENSTEEEAEKVPISVLPPGMRRANPPMSLLGNIMKILASRPRSMEMSQQTEMRPQVEIRPMEMRPQIEMRPLMEMRPQIEVMRPQVEIRPIMEMRPQITRIERPIQMNQDVNTVAFQGPMINPMRGPFQGSMITPIKGPFQGQFGQGSIHLIPIRKIEMRRPEQGEFREDENAEPIILSSQNQPQQMRQFPFIREMTGVPQNPSMEPSFPPSSQINFRNDDEQDRPQLPFPFPFGNGQLPIRVVRLPSPPQGRNIFREEEENEQREESNPEEEQQEGPFPFMNNLMNPIMNLFPGGRTRIIRLRPKPTSEEVSNSELLPFPFPRGALPIQNEPRELPAIHLPPQMPAEASGRALPTPVALPEVRVLRLPFRPQPPSFPEARVITHMEVQQPKDDQDQQSEQDLEQQPQVNTQFFEQQPENKEFRKSNGEFGPPKTHTVIESAPNAVNRDDDIIPFPPQMFPQLRFNPQILDELKPQPSDDNAPKFPEEFRRQLPLEFNPHSQVAQDSTHEGEFDPEAAPQRPQPQFHPRFPAPPGRFAPEGRSSFPMELNPDAEEIIDRHDNEQPHNSHVHRVVLN